MTCRSGTKGELIGGEIRLGGPWEEARTAMGGSSVNLHGVISKNIRNDEKKTNMDEDAVGVPKLLERDGLE